MDNKKIIDAIDTILYKPKYANIKKAERFYCPYSDENGEAYYKFENETVSLLKSLYEKLPSPETKELFLSSLKPSTFFIKPIRSLKVSSKYASENQDFIFMFYIKVGKIQEAFNLLRPGTAITKNTQTILLALREFVSYEWKILSEEQINGLLKDTEVIHFFIKDFENYDTRKRFNTGPNAFVNLWDADKEREYKKTDRTIANQSLPIIANLQDIIYQIKKHILSSYLMEGVNLEINQDQDKMKKIITDFGFSKELNEIVDKINQKLNSATDKFDFKGCIDLIRAFLNDLCVSIAKKLEQETQVKHVQQIEEFGDAVSYFEKSDKRFLDVPEKDFVTSFNKLLCKKGVHVLTSEKEYARISKNVAIEIGLFLLERLQKAKINNSP